MTAATALADEAVGDDELLAQVLEHFDTADREARPLPGRPALLELTGAKEHQLKKAIEVAKAIRRHQRVGQRAAAASAGAPTASVSSAGAPAASTVTNPGAAPDHRSLVGENLASAGSHAPAAVPTSAVWSTRLVTWGGFVFGAAMSIAANVLHTWLPAAHEPPGWWPGLAPQIGAAVWPVSLLFAVEVLARVRWPRRVAWGFPRYLGTSVVAIGSWLISYADVRDVLLAWHYQPLAAAFGPLVLDGLMIVCAFALLADSRTRAGPPRHQPDPASPPPAPGYPRAARGLADRSSHDNPIREYAGRSRSRGQRLLSARWFQPRATDQSPTMSTSAGDAPPDAGPTPDPTATTVGSAASPATLDMDPSCTPRTDEPP